MAEPDLGLWIERIDAWRRGLNAPAPEPFGVLRTCERSPRSGDFAQHHGTMDAQPRRGCIEDRHCRGTDGKAELEHDEADGKVDQRRRSNSMLSLMRPSARGPSAAPTRT